MGLPAVVSTACRPESRPSEHSGIRLPWHCGGKPSRLGRPSFAVSANPKSSRRRQEPGSSSDAVGRPAPPSPSAGSPAARPTPTGAGDLSKAGELPKADLWDNNSFDFLGQVAQYGFFIFAACVAAIGFFASGQYNSGAEPIAAADLQADPAAAIKLLSGIANSQ